MIMPEKSLETWWFSILAALPLIGFWYKTRHDLRVEILGAHAAAEKAHARAEEVRLELSECRLGVQKDFVTHTALDKVTADIKEDAREREARVTAGITGIHHRLDKIGSDYDRRIKPRG